MMLKKLAVNMSSFDDEGVTVPIFIVTPDIEDVQYETVQLFDQNKDSC